MQMARLVEAAQRNEITEYHVYTELAKSTRNRKNAAVLAKIGKDEHRHYAVFKKISGKDVSPRCVKAWFYVWISRILGLTFGTKLMELGEERAQATYQKIAKRYREVARVKADEGRHEKALVNMLDEERLRYMGSIVLGLNDALVELTGALAGFTFALGKTALIARVGLITGIAAAFSMGASEYLSARTEEGEKRPLKSALYTGCAYIVAVAVLILPYFLFANLYTALAFTLAGGLLLILLFTFYLSVARELPFRARFLEMAAISLGVAAASFGIGVLVREVLGIEI